MKRIVYLCTIVIMTIFFFTYSNNEFAEAVSSSTTSNPFFYNSENGLIKIDQSQYLKPKYVHEPTQLHISGKIEDYQRAESTLLTITSPSGDIIENIIRPTREGDFDFISQITSNHSSGNYEIYIIHKEMTIGPAIFKIITETEEKIENHNIPEWVKSNAGWWSENLIGDNDFVEGIQYLINHNIIKIPPTSVGTETGSNEIPEWVKSNAGWWHKGQIEDDDFLRGIQFLVEQKIIKIV